MQNDKKIPVWPLYLADVVMVVAVLHIALNIESISMLQAAILAFTVIAAMVLLVVPYALQYKAQLKLAKENAFIDGSKNEEQFKAVFSDLRALRGKLAGQIEDFGNIEISLSGLAEDMAAVAERTVTVEVAFCGVKAAVADLQSILKESLAASEENGVYDAVEIANRIEALSNLAHSLKREFEDFKNSFEDISDDGTADDGDGIARSDDDDLNEEDFPKIMEEDTYEFCGEEGGEFNEAASLSDDKKKNPTSYGDISVTEKPKQAKSWEGMIEKALSNSQASSTREVVSRFIEKNKNGDAPAQENGIEAPMAEKVGDPFQKDIEKAYTIEEIESSESFKNLWNAGKNKNPDSQQALFSEDEIPQKQKPKPAKSGDTAIIANAFLGIGNKPYVRGEGAGLSRDSGVAMQMLEIGRWQWKCEALTGDEIKITIWLNDKAPSKDGEIVLRPNETLEINLNF